MAHSPQHGNTRWEGSTLLRTALLWALSERRNWRRRYAEAVQSVGVQFHGEVPTFEGFLKALGKRNATLCAVLVRQLRRAMQQVPAALRCIAGREVFAVDGTRLELPRMRANQHHFCVAGADPEDESDPEAGRRSNPQMWLTTLWHVGLALPWSWRRGPGNGSERDDLRVMIGELPPDALVVADAGFVGYDLWHELNRAGCEFVARVGGNVHLIAELEETTTPGLYSFWPNEARRAGRPPMLLRLVQAAIGREQVYLVTNVLDPARLSDEEVVEIYRRRWGIELFYRGLKQTFGRRRLLGRTPPSVFAELDCSMLALWLIHLLGIQETLTPDPRPAALPKRSTSALLDAVRDTLACPDVRPQPGQDLFSRLARAQLDAYRRNTSKTSRGYPRQAEPKHCGPPVIRPPKHEELTRLQTLKRTGQYQHAAI